MDSTTPPDTDRDEWRENDHYVAAPCHCPTCAEVARLDPASRLELPRLTRDGGER